jgi:putative heme transporter
MSTLTQPVASADPGVPRRSTAANVATCAVPLVLGVEAVLVAPHLSGAAAALRAAPVGWVGLAVLAITASLTAFALVRRSLLGAAGVRVSTGSSLASILVSNAFHVTLPGGLAFSTAYSYRWARERGAGATVAGWGLAVNGLLSAACLAGLALAASLLTGGTGWVRLVVEFAAIAAVVVGARHLLRHPHRALPAMQWLLAAGNRVLRRSPDTGANRLAESVAQLRSVRPSGRDWTAATVFALLNLVLEPGRRRRGGLGRPRRAAARGAASGRSRRPVAGRAAPRPGSVPALSAGDTAGRSVRNHRSTRWPAP